MGLDVNQGAEIQGLFHDDKDTHGLALLVGSLWDEPWDMDKADQVKHKAGQGRAQLCGRAVFNT